MDKRVLLFNHGRCGSKSIQFILSKVLTEADNDIKAGKGGKQYFDFSHYPGNILNLLEGGIIETLDRFYQENDEASIFRHRFQDPCEILSYDTDEPVIKFINESVIDYFSKKGYVIFLERKNLLKVAISYFISNNFNISDSPPGSVKGFETKEAHFGKIRNRCERLKREMEYFKSYIEEKDTSMYNLYYQDFFLNSKKKTYRKVKHILNFLGCEPELNSIQKKIINKNTRKSEKVNSKKTYRLIENLDELNFKLGEKYGYLV